MHKSAGIKRAGEPAGEGEPMQRRALVTGVAALAAARAARAAGVILGMTPMGPLRRAFVAQPRIVRQQCPQWCWAASSSMIFAMHGHPLDQREIVARVFGRLACGTAQDVTIARVLSSRWMDDRHRPFSATITAGYDFKRRILTIDNRLIVDELLANRPLLYANTHHAMVLAQVDYIDTPRGPYIRAMGVFDPWPYSPPFHMLARAETIPEHMGGQLSFLAAVRTT